MAKTWECDNCGWTCPADPDPAIRAEETGCGNCGAEMMPVPDDLDKAQRFWDSFAAAAGLQDDDYSFRQDFPRLRVPRITEGPS